MRKPLILALTLTATSVAIVHAQSPAPKTDTAHVLANPGSITKCFDHVHRCIIPVYVHDLPQGRCTAWSDPEKIIVPPANTASGVPRIKVVWVLRRGDKAVKISQYSFDQTLGVKPIDAMQPADQFTSEGHDTADQDNPDPEDSLAAGPASRRFRWASKHPATPQEVHYDFTVLRKTSGFGTKTCVSTDPTITNSN